VRGLLGFHDQRVEASVRALFPLVKRDWRAEPGAVEDAVRGVEAALDRLAALEPWAAAEGGPFASDLAYPCTLQMARMLGEEMGRPPAVPAAIALAALATGCGDDDTTSLAARDLDGRTFVVTTAEGQALVEGSQVSIAFADGSISVQGGCNTLFGGYAIDGSTLALTGPLASTRMACADDLMAQDDWLAAMLADAPDVELVGDALTLATDDVRLTATEST